MIDWNRAIEWTSGEPAEVVEIIPTEPLAYVLVTLPESGKRFGFPDLFRENHHIRSAEVDIGTGELVKFNSEHTENYQGYFTIRNKE